MGTGYITAYIDVAQITLYVFWVFFAALLWYIRQEDRREGYPLESDVSGEYNKEPWLFVPAPKTFVLPHGAGDVQVPDLEHGRDARPVAAERTASFAGAPLRPTGVNPMLDGVGPGSWCDRPDKPDMASDGKAVIVPMSSIDYFSIAEGDPDPRGMAVIGCDNEIAGKVCDVWVDRAEQMIRYFEVDVDGAGRVLLPHNFVRLGKLPRSGDRVMYVKSITGEQFADVPGHKSPVEVTMLEEEKIMAYYGAGTMYATPRRAEPLL